jgi:hypothetical protein
MDDLQDKLGAILSNPQMMQQIMSMAQAFGQNSAPPPAPAEPAVPAVQSNLPDMAMLQKLMNVAQNSGIDRDQQTLLKALRPYLSQQRLTKLEKAMRAARLTGVFTTVLGSTGHPFPSRR